MSNFVTRYKAIILAVIIVMALSAAAAYAATELSVFTTGKAGTTVYAPSNQMDKTNCPPTKECPAGACGKSKSTEKMNSGNSCHPGAGSEGRCSYGKGAEKTTS